LVERERGSKDAKGGGVNVLRVAKAIVGIESMNKGLHDNKFAFFVFFLGLQ
jgi:hypothetical protein